MSTKGKRASDKRGILTDTSLHKGLEEGNMEPIPSVDPKVVENIVDRRRKGDYLINSGRNV